MTGQPKKPDQNNADAPEQDAAFSESSTEDAAPSAEATYSAAQLRMARRKARRLGLNPSNGKQAIRMLKDRGVAIDDNEPSLTDSANASAAAGATDAGAQPSAQPQPLAREGASIMRQQKADNLPAAQVLGQTAPAVISKEERQLEIAKLEKKIKQRRESRMRKLIRRFSLFVILPTIIMVVYYYFIATPLYGANTQMNIQKASNAATQGMQSLFAGTALASQRDSISVQDYLNSRSAFTRLENDYPFAQLFMGDNVDPFLRLSDDATPEDAYSLYRKQVKVTYDNTDQMLRMEVRTPTSQSALAVSEFLLSYAEDQVDKETQRVRDAGVNEAEINVSQKADLLEDAQAAVFDIQEQQGTLSPTADKESLVAQIAAIREQQTQQRLVLMQLESNPNPPSARVNAAKSEISRLQNLIDDLTAEGTAVDNEGQSVARLDQEMRIAETKVALAQQEYEAAVLNLQAAQAEARSQRTFITTSLPPTPTYEPIYPKKFLSSISAFMIFFALYILVSITIEVIREQVSA